MKEHLQLVRNEEGIVAGDAMNARASGIREQQSLRERLREEEEFGSMAVRRMQKAEDQLRHVEDNAKQALPTMHEELNELRRALRLQEDLHAPRSELEAAFFSRHQAYPSHRGLLSLAGNVLVGIESKLFQ